MLTYVCVVGLTVANYYQLANGFGRDADTLEEQSIERFLLVSGPTAQRSPDTDTSAVDIRC